MDWALLAFKDLATLLLLPVQTQFLFMNHLKVLFLDSANFTVDFLLQEGFEMELESHFFFQ